MFVTAFVPSLPARAGNPYARALLFQSATAEKGRPMITKKDFADVQDFTKEEFLRCWKRSAC